MNKSLRNRLYLIVSVALVTAAVTGCNSRLTGNEGNFVFSYPADDDPTNFNKPIAVGAKLDLTVTDTGQPARAVNITAAAFDDPEVLAVASFDGDKIIIEGVGDGTALLEVEGTTADGETLPDSVNMISRVPEVLKLWHTCAAGDVANYFVDQKVWLGFDMEMSNGQPVIGYGYYPVDAAPGASFTLDASASTQRHIAFQAGGSAGSVTLTSQIDSKTLDVEVVTKAQIDGVSEPTVHVWEDIDVGDKNSGYVLPTVGGVAVCQANVTKTVVSDTPTICAVTDKDPPDTNDDASYEFGWFEIEGLAEGDCLYTVTYPEGNGGSGVSEQFTYPIEP
jgi:hypothetical protein